MEDPISQVDLLLADLDEQALESVSGNLEVSRLNHLEDRLHVDFEGLGNVVAEGERLLLLRKLLD